MNGASRSGTCDEDVLCAVDQAVGHEVTPIANAFVERALLRELEEVRRQACRAAWDAASQDPLFLHDLADTEVGFASADQETARSIDYCRAFNGVWSS